MSLARSLLIVVVAWALIYLPGLGSLEIQGEEGRRILPAIEMLKSGNFIVPKVGSDPYFTKPPLVNWLVAASFKLFGARNEWTARLPSPLCILAVAIAFVAIARGALGANGSLAAALIWLTNFGMIEKGRLIEIEALYVSLTGLAFLCWFSWWQTRRSPWLTWVVPWIFLGLGWLAKGPLHLFFFYAVGVAVLYERRELRALLSVQHLVGALLMLAIFVAWAIPCVLMMRESNVAYVWSRQFSGRLSGEDFKFSGWIMNIPRGLGYFLPWVLLLPLLWKRPTSNAQRPTSNSGKPSWTLEVGRWTLDVNRALALGIAASFLAVNLLPGSLPRYTMPLLGAAVWLTAIWLCSQRFTLRLPIAITAITCVCIGLYVAVIIPERQKRGKIRNIATEINAALPPGETLYAIDPDYQPALFYVREPLVYLTADEPLPATARYVVVQPAQMDRFAGAEPLFSRPDYRGKTLALYRVKPESR